MWLLIIDIHHKHLHFFYHLYTCILVTVSINFTHLEQQTSYDKFYTTHLIKVIWNTDKDLNLILYLESKSQIYLEHVIPEKWQINLYSLEAYLSVQFLY